MKQFDCIIVDDDEIDRLSVLAYAKRFLSLKIVGVFETAEKALLFLESNSVSIAFLDIQLQSASGIELRQKALTIPVCVFISSHPENAAETYELQTLDFLVKPFNFVRFEHMMKRVEEFMEVRKKASLFDASIGGDAVYVKSGYDQIKVKMHEILYLEALKNYTILVTESKRHCVLTNLGEILQNDKFNSFIRIHKSFAVQKQYIQKISTQEIELNSGASIPVGRSYKANINVLL
jgi:two-component system, LytTR family, response regulator